MAITKLNWNQRIRQMRNAKGLRQWELGLRCWPKLTRIVAQSRIAHYEKGRRTPSLEAFGCLARALDCSVADILTDVGSRIPTLSWTDFALMHKHATYRLPIMDNSMSPTFNRGDVVEIESTQKLNHNDLVLVADGDRPLTICRVTVTGTDKSFKTLGRNPRRFRYKKNVTRVFGKVISRTIFDI
jgi:transcriptional regulator with XRE-family HTH domain